MPLDLQRKNSRYYARRLKYYWLHQPLVSCGFILQRKTNTPKWQGNFRFFSPILYRHQNQAVKGRGGNDWRSSHDFEDIIYIMNYTPDFVEQLKMVNPELKQYYIDEFIAILARPNIKEEIECALPYGEEDRTDIIISKMEQITSL